MVSEMGLGRQVLRAMAALPPEREAIICDGMDDVDYDRAAQEVSLVTVSEGGQMRLRLRLEETPWETLHDLATGLLALVRERIEADDHIGVVR